MATAADLQTLLRFLSQDAKLGLATAMSKVKELQAAGLSSSAAIAQADAKAINAIFEDEKIAKQVHNAAKRKSKKRGAPDTAASSSPSKRRNQAIFDAPDTPADLEASLALPHPVTDEAAIEATTLVTNRAPLVLAFALALLKYTMPEQPLSSRLSLAQAVVSVNSRSKAVSLGLESGKSAEEEGWGQGQPLVKIMGREIRVLKRWGYEWQDTVGTSTENNIEQLDKVVKEDEEAGEANGGKDQPKAGPEELGNSSEPDRETYSEKPALWGLDLEALKKSNMSMPSRSASASGEALPIYTPQSARAYLLKSFASRPGEQPSKVANAKKPKAAAAAAKKERNLGLLFGALDMLYQSWADTLTEEDLDRRAWSWYVRIRPDVENGVAGWGGKGEVKLADILNLRRRG